MANIFVAHTPFHVFIAEQIVRNIEDMSKSDNCLLLELNRTYEHYDERLWSDVVRLENVGGSTWGRRRFLMSEKNMATIYSIVDRDHPSNLFMSDIAWPMNNRIFFDAYLAERVTYCLFSDGLGTYALPRVTLALYARGVAKSLNGLLKRGVVYRNYRGSQFGLDRTEVKCVYAANAQLIDCEDCRKREIPLTSSHGIAFDDTKCLFLDQPSWCEVDEGAWRLIRQAAVGFVHSLGVRELYYKNHYLGRMEEEIFFGEHGFNVISTNKCAEQVVAENGYGVVVSYLSSALFNLKCMYGARLRCISLFSKTIGISNGFNDDTSDEILALYRNVNVEIVGIL